MPRNLVAQTPTYPWEQLKPIRERAAQHPDGPVDLSIGSPVDPVPDLVQRALADHADTPGYGTAAGSPALREAIAGWYGRRRGVELDTDAVMPTIGSKEFIAQLALWLGLGPDDVVVQPVVHYPTYAVGADATGARLVSSDDPDEWPAGTRLIWLNSPGNPDGRVNDVQLLRRAVARARELDAIIVQDECYAELGWEAPWDAHVPCILEDAVTDGDLHNVLSMYSLSKQSNMAGYRTGIVAGDPKLVQSLVNLRKQFGLSLPRPVQAAMTAALDDDEHVQAQKAVYRRRRELLLPAARTWGLQISDSTAGLYLWGTRGEDGWDTMRALAELGVIGGPGHFYGSAGERYVRLALTATDAAIETAAARLSL
ncbi:succinyldiaminopimelate transaminase [Pseudoclavibacter sp. CFCC 13611]|uniref:succinyldiaminopimelate transaminase n=1 Tax=Pseudoclavibacter sp. CFCC 13611 TaxID=2615178 RepID=UPI0013017581|nr:succinyldiaminopimelate transaminase [Pseudoclavibacter sp. CFCC 13611]KAB1663257.1 succinyldiaminopimelate transaminase [Pseudoclavibacter sp. CFCC 13611]